MSASLSLKSRPSFTSTGRHDGASFKAVTSRKLRTSYVSERDEENELTDWGLFDKGEERCGGGGELNVFVNAEARATSITNVTDSTAAVKRAR